MGVTWGSWSVLGSADQSINAASSHVFGTVDNSGKLATAVSVSVTYGAGTVAANVQIERDIDGTNFEGISAAPWVVPLPAAASSTRERVITVPADLVGKFQVRVVNNSAAAITVTVRVQQAS